MSAFLAEHPRTHNCNQLTKNDVGNTVVLYGWVHNWRDHGGRLFIDLRDRYGLTQIVFKPETSKDLVERATALRSEWCIGIIGTVEDRTKNGGAPNLKLATGEIEVSVEHLEIFNPSAVPPFAIEDNVDTGEEKRLVHRTLDLRRPALQKNFIMRHKVMQAVRRYFDGNGFLELETPILVKYTPGGARNFLVPSRLNAGKFYALAESPQLYKQMFMMAGMDRYFQIVKCFRDEDLRGDRQPEFTQIDVEMSFINEKDIQTMIEGLVVDIFKAALGVDIQTPFMRMTYDESMRRFGNDKPDLRFGLEHVDITAPIRAHNGGGVSLLEGVIKDPNAIIKAMVLPAQHEMSRTETDKLEDFVRPLGAKGLGRAKVAADGAWAQSPLGKQMSADLRLAINAAVGAKEGDYIFFQFGKPKLVHTVMSALRMHLGDRFGLIPKGNTTPWKLLWVTDFPLFEHDDETNTYVAAHHPFTSPKAGHEDLLSTDPGSCRARAYDLVLNGNEVGGGSIRIHDGTVQAKVFDALGISDEEKQAKFGFLLEALRYGAPPHGGIALGMDRLCMLLAGATSLREVIAYPKTQRGTDLLTDAPVFVSEKQLREVHITTTADLSKTDAAKKAEKSEKSEQEDGAKA